MRGKHRGPELRRCGRGTPRTGCQHGAADRAFLPLRAQLPSREVSAGGAAGAAAGRPLAASARPPSPPGRGETDAVRAAARLEFGQVRAQLLQGEASPAPCFPPPAVNGERVARGPGTPELPGHGHLLWPRVPPLPVTRGVSPRFPPAPPSPPLPGGRGPALRRAVPQAALLRRSAPQQRGAEQREGRAGVPGGSQRVALRRYLARRGSVQLRAALRGVEERVVPLPRRSRAAVAYPGLVCAAARTSGLRAAAWSDCAGE